ncbi:MAG TPA: ChaN family lipoprotein [Caldimonas sp.]
MRTTVAVSLLLALVLGACATVPDRFGWETRLRGDSVVLLGEVHDNPEQHRLRLAVLERAFAAGWRPAIVMEQFDRDHQADIEQARRERPGDAQHVIDLAAPAASGWNWESYRPFVALALDYGVPLIAANLSSADATRIVRAGYAAVFDAESIAALGLDRPIEGSVRAAQEHEIDVGHCGVLPAEAWPRMARAQYARDAVMAHAVAAHAAHGAVLLAGNGHARRDIGVPRWLELDAGRVLAIGFLENDSATPPSAFDAVVRTAPAARDDPCARFIAPPRRVDAALGQDAFE